MIYKFVKPKESRFLLDIPEVHSFIKHTEDYTNIHDIENEYGFRKWDRRGCSATVFLNKKQKVVVKFGGVTEIDMGYKHPKCAIPTVFFVNHIGIVTRIQPFADVKPTSSYKAWKHFYDTFNYNGVNSRLDYVGCDFKQGNVALYNNEPVIIDW